MTTVYNLKCINPTELLTILEQARRHGSYLFKLPTDYESAYLLYLVEHRFNTILARVSGIDSACFELCERDLQRVPIGLALTAWLSPVKTSSVVENSKSSNEPLGFLTIGLAWDSHPSAFLIAAQDLLDLNRVQLELDYPAAQHVEATRCARLLFPVS